MKAMIEEIEGAFQNMPLGVYVCVCAGACGAMFVLGVVIAMLIKLYG